MELTLGIFTVSIATVILPFMARSAASNDLVEIKRTLTFSLKQVLFMVVPASVGLALLARPIVNVLFGGGRFSGRSVDYTTAALCCYTLGMAAFSAVRIQAQVFYSFQDVRTPMMAAGWSVAAAVVFMVLLSHPLGHAGIALGTVLGSYVNTALLAVLLRRRLGRLGLRDCVPSAARTLAATIAMLAVIGPLSLWAHMENRPRLDQALLLSGLIPAGILVFAWTARALGSQELSLYVSLAKGLYRRRAPAAARGNRADGPPDRATTKSGKTVLK